MRFHFTLFSKLEKNEEKKVNKMFERGNKHILPIPKYFRVSSTLRSNIPFLYSFPAECEWQNAVRQPADTVPNTLRRQ